MMFRPLGRVALLAFVSIALVCGLGSCASSTLGYLYVTSAEYGQVASLRLDINSGAIKGITCNSGNGNQGNCVTSSGGSYPTKIVLANSDTIAYVLNTASGTTPASISLLTLGSGGSVFTTGQSYTSEGQDPIDMYLNPAGTFLYVLDQYQPADVKGCATPTPATCKGDITVFSIDGKGDLSPVLCQPGDGCISNPNPLPSYCDQCVFQINFEPGPLNAGYGGSRMLAVNNSLFVLDESTPDTSSALGTPEINFLTIRSGGDLYPTPGATPLQPGGSKQLSSIVLGTYIYVSDYQTGQIWIYPATQGSSAISVVCPSALVQPGTACTANPGSNAGQNVALDAMITSGSYLYAADYANNTVFAMQATGSFPYVQATDGGNNTPFGTNTTCLTLSSSPEFIYGSGNGVVIGYQINTSTGGLSTNLHPDTGIPFTQVVPCLMFSPRT